MQNIWENIQFFKNNITNINHHFKNNKNAIQYNENDDDNLKW